MTDRAMLTMFAKLETSSSRPTLPLGLKTVPPLQTDTLPDLVSQREQTGVCLQLHTLQTSGY